MTEISLDATNGDFGRAIDLIKTNRNIITNNKTESQKFLKQLFTLAVMNNVDRRKTKLRKKLTEDATKLADKLTSKYIRSKRYNQ